MGSTETTTALTCPRTPAFDASNLDSVAQALGGPHGISLTQSWLDKPEANFTSATVWTGWRDDEFFVFAKMDDADIFSRATQANQRLWELGDSLEIFLKPDGQEAYSELQVSPNNQQLQLRYEHAAALDWAKSNNSIEKAVRNIAFKSSTWVHPETQLWFALAQIPVSAVRDQSRTLPGSEWQVSFCRYDYTHGRSEPVISSTSNFTKPDFHRTSEWRTMKFI